MIAVLPGHQCSHTCTIVVFLFCRPRIVHCFHVRYSDEGNACDRESGDDVADQQPSTRARRSYYRKTNRDLEQARDATLGHRTPATKSMPWATQGRHPLATGHATVASASGARPPFAGRVGAIGRGRSGAFRSTVKRPVGLGYLHVTIAWQVRCNFVSLGVSFAATLHWRCGSCTRTCAPVHLFTVNV